jgi:hypothetical protein
MVPLGPHDTSTGSLQVTLPDTLAGHHVLGLRLTPPGATAEPERVVDPKQQERLRALGYVQ